MFGEIREMLFGGDSVFTHQAIQHIAARQTQRFAMYWRRQVGVVRSGVGLIVLAAHCDSDIGRNNACGDFGVGHSQCGLRA